MNMRETSIIEQLQAKIQELEAQLVESQSEIERLTVSEAKFRAIAQQTNDSNLKRLEEELRQSEYKFRAIIENANDLIWLGSADGIVTYISPNVQNILGFSPSEITGKQLFHIIHPDDIAIAAASLQQSSARETHIAETRVRHKQGHWLWFNAQNCQFEGENGELFLFGIARNVTEKKQREEELRLAKEAAETANRAKSIFLANMSHELRTPLNVILGFTQLMNRETGLSDRQRNFLTPINRSGEHLLNLINDVLEMSKIEAGRIILNPEPFDLRPLLDTLEAMFRSRAESKNLSLSFHLADNLPDTIVADEGKLRQILINLLSNAVKFTELGSITLQAELRTEPITDEPGALSTSLEFTVTDTGAGIAPEEQALLFQPFVQTTSGIHVKEGTGLGLTISRQYVQLMGGDMQLQSGSGLGSTFTCQIPIVLAQAIVTPQALHQPPAIALVPGQPNYRLLIVDDRIDNCNLLTYLLQDFGFELRTARNGKDAIAQWQSWHPDLIWMDMRMPLMDGYEATRQIRALEAANPDQPKTKIVALTASAFEEQRTTILETGCDDFVRKPFRDRVIFDKLTEHLGIQFIYADSLVDAPSQNQIDPSISVQVMPPEWIQQFQQATIEIDADRLLQLIAEIPPQHAQLAEQLSTLVKRYCFDEILELIESD